MEYGVIAGIVIVSLLSFVVYLFFMFFLPEWVGITGTVAKKAIESHVQAGEGETPSDENSQKQV